MFKTFLCPLAHGHALSHPQAELVAYGRVKTGNDNDVANDADVDMEDDYHADSTGHGAYGGDAATNAEAEDVQARVAAYGRLSGKMNKVQVPSLPKAKAQKVRCVSACMPLLLLFWLVSCRALLMAGCLTKKAARSLHARQGKQSCYRVSALFTPWRACRPRGCVSF